MLVLSEPMRGMFTESRQLYLDFAQIPASTPALENIELFFNDCLVRGIDPKAPEERQRFNDTVMDATDARYLIGNWGEDRAVWLGGSLMARQGRTIHLAVDIFARGFEPVLAPCNGQIVRTGYEEHLHGYGNYLILRPDNAPGLYVFMGHLSCDLPALGRVNDGQVIARVGDFVGQENGGWSRHIHLQMLRDLPPEGQTPIGYSTKADFAENSRRYPSPFDYFPQWNI